MTIHFTVNGRAVSVDGDPSRPLLWVLRETLQLTGTKFGCGAAQCGACTVHVDGRARRSCVLPVLSLEGTAVTTIEGLAGEVGDALVRAWTELDVPQCGWCQTGQIMSAAALLSERREPSDAEIDVGMSGNACRCATYVRIRKAIHRASALLKGGAR
ncbi:MAG: (2Fe-2S)-binding protein [Planctomycetes bacterium]|nr:(2Fe-2S)-binding protein [Planctomycetota bacterium]